MALMIGFVLVDLTRHAGGVVCDETIRVAGHVKRLQDIAIEIIIYSLSAAMLGATLRSGSVVIILIATGYAAAPS